MVPNFTTRRDLDARFMDLGACETRGGIVDIAKLGHTAPKALRGRSIAVRVTQQIELAA